MQFRLSRLIAGPSLYGPRPVILADVVLPRGLDRVPGGWAEEFFRAVGRLQPTAATDRMRAMPDLDAPGPDASPGAVVARLAVLLQRWAGHPVRTFGATATAPDTETLHYEYLLARPGAVAGRVAAQVFLEASRGAIGPEGAASLRQFAEQPVALAYIEAAEARGIPWRATVEGEPALDLGHGRKHARLWMNYTEGTSHIAHRLSTHKQFANAVFRSHGLPVPAQAVVTDEETALRAARAMGFPVVIKPSATDFGTAVHVDLRDDAEVRAAFTDARKHGAVIVEKFIPGDHHRLMTIDGRFTSGRRQRPAHVVGDGVRSVRALVQATNRDRTGRGWKPVPLDAEAESVMARQGYRPDAVPPAGQEVRLRTQGNLSQGGSMDVVTDAVHPDNALLAVRAAAILGIDVSGLDFITTDITRSWLEGGGAICEINATPGLIMGEEPLILACLFQGGDDGRIPTVAVLDPDPASDLPRRVAALLSTRFAPVTVATSAGAWLGDHRIAKGDQATAAGARIALWEPSAGAAVVEVRTPDFVQHGLGFDRCSVLVVPSPSTVRPDVLRAVAATAGLVLPDVDDPARVLDALP